MSKTLIDLHVLDRERSAEQPEAKANRFVTVPRQTGSLAQALSLNLNVRFATPAKSSN
ncbi:MAG: hypothetical protein ACTHWH_08370 [Marinobacter sp.]